MHITVFLSLNKLLNIKAASAYDLNNLFIRTLDRLSCYKT